VEILQPPALWLKIWKGYLVIEIAFERKGTQKYKRTHVRYKVDLMMEPVSIFDTSVSLYQTTQRSIPEDSNFLPHRREKLKSHLNIFQLRTL
jgi:hypothetical protein